MSGQPRLPIEIDPFRMADLGRRFEGNVEIDMLKRVLPLLDSTAGSIEVKLDFGIDDGGIRYVQGKLDTILKLRCQRCLETMDYPLQSEFRLAFVQSDSEAERLPEQYEPQLIESTPVRLLDMIEDELLLSIPNIPMHDETACSVTRYDKENELVEQQDEEGPKANPFAVLEKLKKDH